MTAKIGAGGGGSVLVAMHCSATRLTPKPKLIMIFAAGPAIDV